MRPVSAPCRDRGLAAHEDGIEAVRELGGVLIGRAGVDLRGVKDVDVGVHPLRQHALGPKAHDCGRAAGHLMHGCFKRKDLLFADKMLQQRGIGPVDARVEHAGGGIGAVGDDAAVPRRAGYRRYPSSAA